MSGERLAQRMADLAQRIARLRPDWNNPQRFFEERSELEHEARRMAQEVK
jgi:hypothetical protein